ncbi:MAG: hypothetical protein N2235_12715 [Fischerella sp.]|nr:hypothetical protein [Fischerella sp.]
MFVPWALAPLRIKVDANAARAIFTKIRRLIQIVAGDDASVMPNGKVQPRPTTLNVR